MHTQIEPIQLTPGPGPQSEKALSVPLNRASTRVILAVVLLAFCIALFGYRLAARDLWSSHEGRAAQDAQSLLDQGFWNLPRLFDKRIDLQKPPLYYWLIAAASYLNGGQVDAFSVRLPSFLAALAGVMALVGFGVAIGRPVAGLLAAFVLATAVHFTSLARTGRIDMPLALTVGMAVGGFYLGMARGPARGVWHWFLIAYIAMAAGVLLKGPIGAVLPLAVVAVWLGTERRLPWPWQTQRIGPLLISTRAWWGLPLVLVIVLPWYVWANRETNGTLLTTFFWRHHVERALGGADGMRARPWYLYGPYLFGYFLPWSLLLPFAVVYAWRQRDREARFGLVCLATIVGVLSLARFKRADYLAPAYPGAALAIGCLLEDRLKRGIHVRRTRAGLAAVALACLVGWFGYIEFWLPRIEPAREHRRFAAEIRKLVPSPELVLFFRAEAHALAFHLGPELDTFLEWENLDIWAGRPGTHYIIMPENCAREWESHVTSGRLVEVMRCTDFDGATHRERPLVLMRTLPHSAQSNLVVNTPSVP